MKETALKASKSLASFYRMSLSSGNEIITIKDELELTKSYLEIQGLRYSEYLDYDFEIDEQINKYYIQKLMLQPIVENAIYHGIKPLERRGKILIKGRIAEDNVVLSVWDNGVGIDGNIIENILSSGEGGKNSFGLASINHRIKLAYGDEYGLRIDSKIDEYTNVEIVIPKKENKFE
jgi:two-component system sensor histidine kinase YesM